MGLAVERWSNATCAFNLHCIRLTCGLGRLGWQWLFNSYNSPRPRPTRGQYMAPCNWSEQEVWPRDDSPEWLLLHAKKKINKNNQKQPSRVLISGEADEESDELALKKQTKKNRRSFLNSRLFSVFNKAPPTLRTGSHIPQIFPCLEIPHPFLFYFLFQIRFGYIQKEKCTATELAPLFSRFMCVLETSRSTVTDEQTAGTTTHSTVTW